MAELVDPMHPPFEERGNEEDGGQLGQLGRLNAKWSRAQTIASHC